MDWRERAALEARRPKFKIDRDRSDLLPEGKYRFGHIVGIIDTYYDATSDGWYFLNVSKKHRLGGIENGEEVCSPDYLMVRGCQLVPVK